MCLTFQILNSTLNLKAFIFMNYTNFQLDLSIISLVFFIVIVILELFSLPI